MKKGPYFQPVQYISPLPEGYLQAASSIGQSYGRAIESIGDNISGAIKKYQKDKEESEFLTGQAESLTPLLQSFQGDIRDQNTKVKFDDITKKLGSFASQSLSQKRATLASAGTLASSFDRVRQNENAKTQRELLVAQLDAIKRQDINEAAYSAALSNVQNFRNETYAQPGTAMAGLLDQSKLMNTPSSPAPNLGNFDLGNVGQFDVAALQRFQGTPPPAAPASVPPASLPPPVELTPRQAARVAESSLFSQGVNARRAAMNPPPAAPAAPVPQTSTMPTPSSLAFRSERLGSTPDTVAIPQSKLPQAQDLPTVPTETTQTRQVRITNEEKYGIALANYLKEGGRLTPKINDDFKKQFNIKPDVEIKVDQIKDNKGNVIGTAVLQDGELKQFLKPETAPGPESSIGKLIFDLQEAALKGNKFAFDAIGSVIQKETANSGVSLTENQGNSLNYALRMLLNEDELEKTQYQPQAFGSDLWVPERFKTSDRKLYETAKSNWISANLRKESGAAIGPNEFETANTQYFPQSGDNKDVIEAKARLRKQAYLGMTAAIGPQGPDLINKYSIRDKPNVNKTTTGKDTAGRTIIVERKNG